eukprot:TRINITY_DN4935_c1_g2_i1.p1 TRINITY_DN4935_c1_g2~~TRINITY_DN4935_c1_g2_i1.p1  ORF type:complete len:551 (+),score=84.29 TRINITY_DN4935_c1_g2_i1:291-1943(+)
MELKWNKVERVVCPMTRDCHSCVKWGDELIVYGGHTFEGNGGVGQLGDVWSFSEKQGWCEVGTGGIESEGHTAVICGNSMIIYGGMSAAGEAYNKTRCMECDTGQWTTEDTECDVPPRFYHTASCSNSVMYVYGGCDNDEEFGDLWLYHVPTKQWASPDTQGVAPSPRYCHSSCITSSYLYIFGGCKDTTNYNDLHRLNLSTLEWSIVTPVGPTRPPMPRYGMAITIDVERDLIFMFGGQDDHCKYNELYVCKINSDDNTCAWAFVPVSLPPENRTGHSLKYTNDALYLFGGHGDEETKLSHDILKLSLPSDIECKVSIWTKDESEYTRSSSENEDSEYESTEDTNVWLAQEDAMAGEIDFDALKARLKIDESVTTTCTSIGTSTSFADTSVGYTRPKTVVKATPPPSERTPSPRTVSGGAASSEGNVNASIASTVGNLSQMSGSTVNLHSAFGDLQSSLKRQSTMLNNRIQENSDAWKMESSVLKNRLSEMHEVSEDGHASLSKRIDSLEATMAKSINELKQESRSIAQQMERLVDVIASSSLGSPGLK